MTRRPAVLVAVLATFATAVVLSAASAHGPSALEMKAYEALAAARPAAAAAPEATAVAGVPVQHRPPPTSVSTSLGSSAPAPPPTAPAPAPVAESDPAETAEPTPTPGETPEPTPTPRPPANSGAGHVFVIALSGPGYQETFGADSPATYLTEKLRPQGAVLSSFAPLDGAELPNYMAFAGGQPPNELTQGECASYREYAPSVAPDEAGIVSDDGCILPVTVLSLGDQVAVSGGSWRAYSQSMADGEEGSPTCRHPVSNERDPTFDATEGYATRHNPFVYFHSLLDLGDCLASAIDLDVLKTDLKVERTTPTLAFIAPDLCHDGSLETCGEDDEEAGLAAADDFLAETVPRILASKAFKQDGVLIVTFLSNSNDTKEPTGTLVVAPKFAKPGTVYAAEQDPFSLLRSVEDLLELQPLGKAKTSDSFAKLVLPKAF